MVLLCHIYYNNVCLFALVFSSLKLSSVISYLQRFITCFKIIRHLFAILHYGSIFAKKTMEKGMNVLAAPGKQIVYEKMLNLYNKQMQRYCSWDHPSKTLKIFDFATNDLIKEVETSYKVALLLNDFIETGKNGFDGDFSAFNQTMLVVLGYGIERSKGKYWFIARDNSEFLSINQSALISGKSVFAGTKQYSIKKALSAIYPNYKSFVDADGFISLRPQKQNVIDLVRDSVSTLVESGECLIDVPFEKVMSVRAYYWNMGIKGLSFSRKGENMLVYVNGKVSLKDQVEEAIQVLKTEPEFAINGDFSKDYVYQYIRAQSLDFSVKLKDGVLYLMEKQEKETMTNKVLKALSVLTGEEKIHVDEDGDEKSVKLEFKKSSQLNQARAVITKYYPGIFSTKAFFSASGYKLEVWRKISR